jgi:uncharacterized damage-inducible protein DinB
MKVARVAALAAVAVVAVAGTALADIRSEYITNIKDVEEKIISLAKATPEKKFTWRPAKGVRSISEVYMHVVGANYVLPSFCGVKPPDGISPEMEKSVTAKAQVVEHLESSFKHLRAAIENTPEADLDKMVKTFLGDMSERAVYLLAVSHGHEHLGQSIAYARVNGVTPPWTAADEAKAKQKAAAEK